MSADPELTTVDPRMQLEHASASTRVEQEGKIREYYVQVVKRKKIKERKKDNYKECSLISLVPDRDSVRGKRNKIYCFFQTRSVPAPMPDWSINDEMIFCILSI